MKSGFFAGENANSDALTIASVKRNMETFEVEAIYIYASAIIRVSKRQAVETFIHEFFHTTKNGTILYEGYRKEIRPFLIKNGYKLPSYSNRIHEHWTFAITAEALKYY